MKAIITTSQDLSAQFFERHGWHVYRYDKLPSEKQSYDYIYLRDPFNDEKILPSVGQYVKKALSIFNFSKSIDNVDSFETIEEYEDKYNQFRRYHEFMPNTFLPSEVDFKEGKHLAKKRISQRARGICFHKAEFNDDWIVQDLMDINEELRVYAIFGKVIEQATVKSSKSVESKVKIIGKRNLGKREKDFCRKIVERSELDFIGIDLAILQNGDLKLVEVNRSPQFKRFVELYDESLLADILDI